MSADKLYLGAADLLRDSFRLAARIYQSGFRPDFIVALWRGGTPVGIAVQEYFEFKGVSTDHIAVRTSAYTGIGEQAKQIRVHGLHYLLDNLAADRSLLVVDDVFDTGRSVEALLNEMRHTLGSGMPATVKIACPWYKPSNNLTDLAPDYFLHQTDQWLVFPHELSGLAYAEIASGKAELQPILELFQSKERGVD